MRSAVLLVALLWCSIARAQMPGGSRPSGPVAQATPTMPGESTVPDGASGASASDVVYGKVGHDKLRLDVYLPKENKAKDGKNPVPRAAVIVIHGGAWQEGDKSQFAQMSRWLQKNGFVVFNINYRLFDGKHNVWPAQLDDAQLAVRWVRANATKYNVDARHIGALGHSSGAQMAALLGELNTPDKDIRDHSDAALAGYSSKVQAVVEVAGPADLTKLDPQDEEHFFLKFLGGTLAQKPEAWRDASPVFHVSKDASPFLIVHGTRDTTIPIGQSEELAAALDRAGVPEHLVKVNDGHFIETEAAQHTLASETVAFFHRTLSVEKTAQ